MKQTVYLDDFINAFKKVRPNQFTREGLISLYNYITEYENDTGEELDLDVIALCCDYTEYKNFQELKKEYLDYETLEDFQDKTTVIPIENTQGLIVRQF